MVIVGVLLIVGGVVLFAGNVETLGALALYRVLALPLAGLGFFVLVVGLVVSAINRQGEATRRALTAAREPRLSWFNSKRCPMCAERIQKAAKKCRYCGSAVDA